MGARFNLWLRSNIVPVPMTYQNAFRRTPVPRGARFSSAAGSDGSPEIMASEEFTPFDTSMACHARKKWDPHEAGRAPASTREEVADV